MRRLVILGGEVHDTPLLRRLCKQEHFQQVIAADSGLNWAYRLGIRPDRMLGDFDSVEPEILQYYRDQRVQEEIFSTRKDYTDSELALWAAMDVSAEGDEIWMLGGIGSRMDHTLANIFLLYEPLQKGINACLLDGLNEIRLLHGPCEVEVERREEQKYLSILPFLGDAEGIDLIGTAYPLKNYTLRTGKCIGISNEVEDEQAVIRLKKGYLLLIRSTNDTPAERK